MTDRPSRSLIAGEWLLLLAAVAGAVLLAPEAEWDLAAFGILLFASVASDMRAIRITAQKVLVSGSFLAIIAAIVILGATPAALIAVITTLTSWATSRYAKSDLLLNVTVYAAFPLIAGAGFHRLEDQLGIDAMDPAFYLMVVGLFVVALGINIAAIAAYTCYVERSDLSSHLRLSVVPVIPSELAAALLAVGITFAYEKLGIPAVALFAIVLLVFQYLVRELLRSQERAVELAQRAKTTRRLPGRALGRAPSNARPSRPDDCPSFGRRGALLPRALRARRARRRGAGARPHGRPPPRHRQVRPPRPDPQVPRPALSRGLGPDPAPSLRGSANRLADRRLPACRRDHHGSPRAARRPRLSPGPDGGADSADRTGSSPSPTPTTR